MKALITIVLLSTVNAWAKIEGPSLNPCVHVLSISEDVSEQTLRATLATGSIKNTIRYLAEEGSVKKFLLEVVYATSNNRYLNIRAGFVKPNAEDAVVLNPISDFDRIKVQTMLNNNPEISKKWGKTYAVTNSPRETSFLAWATPEGKHYSDTIGPFHILMIDRDSMEVRVVLKVDVPYALREILDKNEAIGEYAAGYLNSLEELPPTPEQLRSYNEDLQRKFRIGRFFY